MPYVFSYADPIFTFCGFMCLGIYRDQEVEKEEKNIGRATEEASC